MWFVTTTFACQLPKITTNSVICSACSDWPVHLHCLKPPIGSFYVLTASCMNCWNCSVAQTNEKPFRMIMLKVNDKWKWNRNAANKHRHFEIQLFRRNFIRIWFFFFFLSRSLALSSSSSVIKLGISGL